MFDVNFTRDFFTLRVDGKKSNEETIRFKRRRIFGRVR